MQKRFAFGWYQSDKSSVKWASDFLPNKMRAQTVIMMVGGHLFVERHEKKTLNCGHSSRFRAKLISIHTCNGSVCDCFLLIMNGNEWRVSMTNIANWGPSLCYFTAFVLKHMRAIHFDNTFNSQIKGCQIDKNWS